MSVESFFSEEQKKSIRKAIEEAELKTSGEIRVHISQKCKGDVLKVAEKVFGKLKMHKTELRNGVLFYLAVDSRVFAIYGDKGINEKVPGDFWNSISEEMEKHFRKGEFTEGLEIGIAKAGEQLSMHFPHTNSDKNELTNEISFK
jgi:uncharacterized membrane protein